MNPRSLLHALGAVALVVASATPSAAQLPSVGGIAGAVGDVVGQTRDTVGNARDTATGLTDDAVRDLRSARLDQLRLLRRQNPELIDVDRDGLAVIRSEVLAIAPGAAALAAAQAQGFQQVRTIDNGDLGVRFVVLRAPRGLTTRRAVEALRRLDPQGAYEYNHLYSRSGQAQDNAGRQGGGGGGGPRIGLVDSGVSGGLAAQQRSFASGASSDAHGTQVASLLRRAAPGAQIYAADVYGAAPTGGGADAIISGLGWLAQQRTPVINVSLVGPPNRALEAAVRALISRGHVIVAAVGNDGPSAPPLYPAAYPGVIGVTGVDARNRALPEAGRGPQVDFAAPGSDLEAAGARVRGTSFAAPIVAGLIARRMSSPGADAASRAQAALAQQASDLGARGPDRVFGAGLVGAELRGAHVARR